VLCGSISARPSPFGVAMHNAAYKAAGLPFTYVAFGVENTREAVLAVRYFGIRGLGVSMPHKIAVMQYLDALDEMAAHIGAVNTVVNDDGCLTGYNTDWLGAVRALQENLPEKEATKVATTRGDLLQENLPEKEATKVATTRGGLAGKRAAVIGAGGAARAIVYGLIKERCQVTVYNRTAANGAQLAQDLGARFGGGLDELSSGEDFDVLVNATSVGFHAPDESVVPPAALRAGQVVLDVVFIPPRTKLVREAEARGCVAVPGTRMLVHQAACQFELYTGQRAPFEVMEQALLETINRLPS